jgi:hypothetical protein
MLQLNRLLRFASASLHCYSSTALLLLLPPLQPLAEAVADDQLQCYQLDRHNELLGLAAAAEAV